MNGYAVPNDLMQKSDPVSILVFAPILNRVVYPSLQKMHISSRPINNADLFWIPCRISENDICGHCLVSNIYCSAML